MELGLICWPKPYKHVVPNGAPALRHQLFNRATFNLISVPYERSFTPFRMTARRILTDYMKPMTTWERVAQLVDVPITQCETEKTKPAHRIQRVPRFATSQCDRWVSMQTRAHLRSLV